MIRDLVRLLTVLALVATALLVPATRGTSPATAADLRYFDPANIIADAVFFDSLAMDASAVQAFLTTKGARCVAGEMPCLKDYAQDTADQPGDAYCATYRGAARETAATMITKIGRACGINPRVLLVLLQKEQGLVTGTRPSVRAYTKATGFACPDTSPCNPAFSGFASQVYFAARQFQRYAAGVAGSYRAGRVNNVLYHPNSACGSAPVLIQNKATAGLYSYTPYQPNGAALAAGYGTGDACSSYGNRNFWNHFTDWFGSTQSSGGGAILAKYQSTGGSAGPLGAVTSPFWCGLSGGGCFQAFSAGSIYWSPATGASVVHGRIRDRWAAQGWENGGLGYPVSDTTCGLSLDGCYQLFQNGSVYASPTTATSIVRGGIREAWSVADKEYGPYGYPTTEEIGGLRAGGVYQLFQNGTAYWSPATGAHLVRGPIQDRFKALGSENYLGYPLTSTLCNLARGGCYQPFEYGTLYSSASTATSVVRGGLREAWVAAGSENGPLGYPTTDEAGGARGGAVQEFENGTGYWSPATGARLVYGAVDTRYAALGAGGSGLGYPVTDTLCGLRDAGCYQFFQNGTIYSSSVSPTSVVRGGIREAWVRRGAENGPLGFPTTDEIDGLPNGGVYQLFQQGSAYWSPTTGAHVVYGAVRDRYRVLGAEGGLGYPLSDTLCGLREGGCYQFFERGTLYSSAVSPTSVVRGGIREAWSGIGLENGPLGFPLTDETAAGAGGGSFQHFQGGSIWWSPRTGAHVLTGAIRDHWQGLGGEAGSLGYPAGNPVAVPGGTTQRFEGGTLRLNATTGAVTLA